MVTERGSRVAKEWQQRVVSESGINGIRVVSEWYQGGTRVVTGW